MSEDLREVTDDGILNEMQMADVAILYKHSNRCPISWGAKREVDRFLERESGVPVYLIDVVKNRALSLKAAEMLSVKHESPQAILLRSGEAVEHVSHRQITASRLENWSTQ
jgi:bacillithiol system protein YtxJ